MGGAYADKEPAPALLRETVLVLVLGGSPMRGDCSHNNSAAEDYIFVVVGERGTQD